MESGAIGFDTGWRSWLESRPSNLFCLLYSDTEFKER